MAVQITTGEYTDVIIANHKDSKSINVVQQLNVEAQAKSESIRAFNDGGDPLVVSTDMGDTTGNISVIKSSSTYFENIVLGKLAADTLASFSLKDAIKSRFAIFANYKDKLDTTKIYGSMAAVGCVLNSDGTQEAVNGTLQNTYNITATSKVNYPYAIAVESLTATTGGVLTTLHTPVALVAGGKDIDGNDVSYLFEFKNATSTDVAPYTPVTTGTNVFSTNTITNATGIISAAQYIVAYLYVS